jgi:hypothetical protein
VSCRGVRGWLHRDLDSLDEAQRLVLEDHLAGCARCRADRGHLRMVHEVGAALPVPPTGARLYSRAIARALLEDHGRAIRALRPRWPRVASAVLAVAAVAIAVALVRGGHDAPRVADRDAAAAAPTTTPTTPALTPAAPTTPTPPTLAPVAPPRQAASPEPLASPPQLAAPAPAPRPAAGPSPDIVERGALVHQGAAHQGAAHQGAVIEDGAAVPADASLRAARQTRLLLASSRVVVAAASEIRWSPGPRTLALERGEVEVDVRGAGVSRIVTERFDVQLADATVTVDATRVRVRRGAAQIVDRAGARIRVPAGRTWRPSRPAARATERTERIDLPASPSAVDLVALARAQFAARELATAEQTAARALAAGPSRGEQAEARILLADIAQASGALDVAVARYTAVATAFAEAPAAESALYAVARIELRRGRPAAARAHLERYLERYPTGRYADDVRRDLASLP